jgi:hypothetical protein
MMELRHGHDGAGWTSIPEQFCKDAVELWPMRNAYDVGGNLQKRICRCAASSCDSQQVLKRLSGLLFKRRVR